MDDAAFALGESSSERLLRAAEQILAAAASDAAAYDRSITSPAAGSDQSNTHRSKERGVALTSSTPSTTLREAANRLPRSTIRRDPSAESVRDSSPAYLTCDEDDEEKDSAQPRRRVTFRRDVVSEHFADRVTDQGREDARPSTVSFAAVPAPGASNVVCAESDGTLVHSVGSVRVLDLGRLLNCVLLMVLAV